MSRLELEIHPFFFEQEAQPLIRVDKVSVRC